MPAEMSEGTRVEGQDLAKNNKTEQEQTSATATALMDQELMLNIIVHTPKGQVISLGCQSSAEAVATLKSILSDYLDTCTYTSYHLEQRGQGKSGTVVLNDYTELKQCMIKQSSNVSENEELDPKTSIPENLVLYMVEEPYDVRTARLHLARLLEIRKAIPMKASTPDAAVIKDKDVASKNAEVDAAGHDVVEDNSKEETQKENEKTQTKVQLELDVNDLQNRIFLNKFYDSTLLQFSPKAFKFSTSLEGEISSLTLSGWNPPTPSRKMHGDLVYIEVVTSSEVFLVTGILTGFYVNKSTGSHFDPLPASKSCFAHELLDTIMMRCDHVREKILEVTSAEAPYANKRKSEKTIGGDLEDIAGVSTFVALHQGGKFSELSQIPSWVYPPEPCTVSGKKSPLEESSLNGEKGADERHDFDLTRAQNDLCATFGAELFGPPREWNDEIQTIRAMPTETVQQKMMRYRLVHKIVDEFVAACKPASVAITEGHIVPLNPMDPKDTHIFIYNNIFFSRVIDSKESFKFSEGDEACKKNAAFDIKNQKRIQSLGVEGLHTGLAAIIDYKGHRIMAQSILPGILSSGERPARLVYGCLEHDKRIVCKEKAIKMLKQLAEKVHLQESIIVNQPDLGMTLPAEAPVTSANTFEATLGESQSIKIDEDGEVSVTIRDKTTLEIIEEKDVKDESKILKTIPHIGPLEGKLIEGSDGRIYCLEFFRLTPRDVNYVKGERGTGLVDEKVIDEVGENDCRCYLLRHELFLQYIQQTLQMKRREVVMETINEQKGAKQAALESAAGAAADESATNSETDGEKLKAIETMGNGDFKITPEVAKKLGAITDEVSSMKINPNVFMSEKFAANVDRSQELKDEETARKVSKFLWETMLPQVTEAVQSSEMIISDNRNMVIYLHSLGINMRYLGRLAELAWEQEKEDLRLLQESKQRQNSMHKFWLEFLEIEMLARGFKHLMRKYLSSDDAIAVAPAYTISKMLSYLLGLPKDQKLEGFFKETDSKAKNKKIDKNIDNMANQMKSLNLNVIPKELEKRSSFFADLKKEIFRRFGGYKLRLIRSGTDVEESSTPVADSDAIDNENIVINRICRQSLLRRICQLSGIRVAQKDYNLDLVSTEAASMKLSSSPPTKFSVTSFFTPVEPVDILELVPIVRSCEADCPCPESRDAIATSRQLYQQGNVEGALDAAQESLQWIQQVTNGAHKEMINAYETLVTVLLTAQDASTALSLCARSLFTAVQMTGFDSFETLQSHLHLQAILSEVGEYHLAIKHLMAARYITMLMGGERHPQIVNILQRLGGLFKKTLNFDEAIACYEDIHKRLAFGGDQINHAVVLDSLAETYCMAGHFKAAIYHQRSSHHLLEQLLGAEHEHTVLSKAKVNGYYRKKTEAEVAAAKKKMEDDEAEKERMRQNWLEEDESPKANDRTSNGNTKTSKNKNVKKGGKSGKKK